MTRAEQSAVSEGTLEDEEIEKAKGENNPVYNEGFTADWVNKDVDMPPLTPEEIEANEKFDRDIKEADEKFARGEINSQLVDKPKWEWLYPEGKPEIKDDYV